MSDVTGILASIERGESGAAAQLLPLVYDELRHLAAAMMASERPGRTLQATALVHEAYARLVVGAQAQRWESRRHFFGAAARRKIDRVELGSRPRARSTRRISWPLTTP